MAWAYLAIAAAFEVAFAMSMKYADGFTRMVPTLVTVASVIGGIGFLTLAMKTLPVSVAYPVWTAIGTLGTVVLGFVLLNEALTLPKLVSALAILWDSGTPILFRQRRMGRDGKPFTMLKLRSMRVDAEKARSQLRQSNEVDGPVFKIANDPRFTRVGRFLRKYSLDELPQLWNVLIGDMSIVGPRPLQDGEMRLSPAWREARMRVKPGLTGLWQVSSRERGRFQDWIQHDLRYVRAQSFSLDLKIVVRTLLAIAKGL